MIDLNLKKEDFQVSPKTQKNINLIYKHTHKDFKGINYNEKCVMYYNNGTTSGPISTMPDDIFHEFLRNAKAKELRLKKK